MRVKVSREAASELESAVLWYEMEQPGLGLRLIDAFDQAVTLLSEPNPPLVSLMGLAASYGAKRLLLHGFPFSIVTIQQGDMRIIVAVAHFKKLPDYWLGRVTR